MEISNPNLNVSASLSDSSKNDDSFSQSKTTVNIGSGATYNQNCGNSKEMSRRQSMWTTIILSFICDLFVIFFIVVEHDMTADKLAAVQNGATESYNAANARITQVLKDSDDRHKEMMRQAKAGTIWLLRDDIIKTIDFHETIKTITEKQYRRIKDEFDYYTSIGGNHDVKDRWDSFNVKILSNDISITKDGIK